MSMSMSRASTCYIELHRATLNTINSQLHVYFEKIWREKLNAEFAVRGQDAGSNKLRTYRKFKENYDIEQYVKVITQKR